jgi:hypothetical protein
MRLFILLVFLLVAGIPSNLWAQNSLTPGGELPLKGPHPMIIDIAGGISKDSLAAHIRSLVSLGTRFQYAENRRQVAEFISGKFRSLGYPDVALDSFKISGQTIKTDSIWQYNVVATVQGSSAPDEIYLVSAHYDDYAGPDSRQAAPGADDNASGVATVWEIARVLKAKGFRPASTIRFIAWAAEEMTIHIRTSGSIVYAGRMASAGEDLRLSVCNDMVASTSGKDFQAAGSCIHGKDSWAGELLASCSSLYTSLKIIPKDEPVSDNYRFQELGFPTTGFMEYKITPSFHTIYDSLSRCNMDFCREVAKATCAVLLNEQLAPVPQDPVTDGGKDFIQISWKRTANRNVKSFNIYRTTLPDSTFLFIARIDASRNSWKDTDVVPGCHYQYRVTSLDDRSFESIPSARVIGSCSP